MWKITKVPEFFKEWLDYENKKITDIENHINSQNVYVDTLYGTKQSVIDVECIKCGDKRTKTKNCIRVRTY